VGIVLLIDDQAPVRIALELLFEAHGVPCEGAASAEEALARVARGGVDVAVQDMNFRRGATSGEEGVALFRALRRLDPSLPVVLLTAWTSLETAVGLVKEGAADYLAKPWNNDRLVVTVRALRDPRLQLSAAPPIVSSPIAPAAGPGGLTGYDLCGAVHESAPMRQLLATAVHVARASVPVLLLGPNGAGKEKLAEIIHANSERKGRPFLKVNAGAIADSLLEAELFGVEAGAFTGASRSRPGHFEAADGGTLFLDEIGNLSLPGQMRLLRVLQSGEYQRVGSAAVRRVDVRIISATNADLSAAIAARSFREDLYFRLNVIELFCPPLVERLDDVPALAAAFLAEFRRPDRAPWRLSPRALVALLAHGWPGNVRELRNAIQRATLLCPGAEIEPEHLGLPLSARRPLPAPGPPRAAQPAPEPPRGAPLAARHPPPTREQIEAALARADGRIRRAAADLGLSRQALYRLMDKLGLDLASFRDPGDDDRGEDREG
jgi:DNA-binding NtrC family response regulator